MVKDRIDRAELGDKILALTQNAAEGSDPLREMAEMVLNFISEAEATAKIGAEVYERSEERATHRNGYRDCVFRGMLISVPMRCRSR
jgi:transposase-like protein